MIVFGIDAGYAITGYAIIDKTKKERTVIDYGVVTTDAGIPIDIRLKDLYEALVELMKKHKPDIVVIEQVFYFKNQKTFANVLQARGVTILAAINLGIPVAEYTPLQIKQALTGYGRATKNQVQEMVKIELELSEIPKPDDAADALAICLTYIQTEKP